MNLGETYVLDGIDRQLLDELQSDCKRSLKEIGGSVGLSAPSVMERVRKLENAGIILGYHALLDARKVGLDISAFIGVSISNPQLLSAFEEWVDSMPQVLECHHVTGSHTLLLKVKTQNTEDLEQLISRVRSMEGVASTETMVVLSTHTERVEVALPAAEPASDTRRRKRSPPPSGHPRNPPNHANMKYGLPEKHGLYDPANEKDACGVGFVAQIKGVAVPSDRQGRQSHPLQHGPPWCARGSETNTGRRRGDAHRRPGQAFAARGQGGARDRPSRAGQVRRGQHLPTDRRRGARVLQGRVPEVDRNTGAALPRLALRAHRPGRAPTSGPTAAESMPHIEQLFIGAADGLDQDAFERQLYAIRKSAASPLRVDESLKQRTMLYACSLSSRTIIYKGMLACEQVLPFYGDLTDPDYETHLAMVHSRFATNTFPTWERSQPLRCLSHNGEINTLRGNKNAMHSRQGVVEGELFGDDLRKLFPVAEPGLSDSGTLDNVLEFLYMNGRTMAEAAMLMIPEAWQRHEDMPQVKRDFYEYHSCLMEPWDGPASIAFTDGTVIGALLDRNGLRPSRYYLTHDDRVIMASEVGVLPVPPEMVKHKGRLKPGRMFLIDFEQGRMIPDVELKNDIASQRPYGEWLNEQRLKLTELPVNDDAHGFDPETLLSRMQSFGYTTETMQFMLRPMIEQQRDPVGSMGNDSALAVLSDQPRLAYDYFKQLFAQVTNPPIDSIREEVIMAVECYIGPEKNLLTTTPEHAHRLRIPHPILTNEEVNALKTIDERGWRSKIIDVTWPRSEGAEGLEPAIQRIRQEAEQAVEEGYSLIVLTDRATGKDRIPVSALLATGAAHHHLVATEKRTRVGIVVETGEAREVHHHCCLVGYGADAINPYLAFEALWQERRLGTLDAETFADDDSIVTGLSQGGRQGHAQGVRQDGASRRSSRTRAHRSSRRSGLNSSVVDLCFAGTASRIQGIGFNVIAQELVDRHELGYRARLSPGFRSFRTTGSSIGAPRASGTCGTRRRSPTSRWRRARTSGDAYRAISPSK